ncbi:MAG: ATP-dependent helicase [Coriobacteriales bacterium]|jgi:DNA helicase-2/ATP-dependent DNA helicase PcrA|nr:ATP-dependent helicase [Coriobacteriales bacterium]
MQTETPYKSDAALSALANEIQHLNNEQRRAVEALDGPVLVVAGPGTGKTQLLSLRVANILAMRDVAPHNILCLTFTNAGAEAMTRRLTRFIGRDALGVHVATFHSFAEDLRSRFPEFFSRGAYGTLISELQSRKLLSALLAQLSIDDALYRRSGHSGIRNDLSAVAAAIGTIKNTGLRTDEMRSIVAQNRATIEHFEKATPLLALVEDALTGGKAAKCAKLDALRETVASLPSELDRALLAPVVQIPGTYVPYARYVMQLFAQTELYDEQGKTTGFQGLRKELFGDSRPYAFTDRAVCDKLESLLGIYDQYHTYLMRYDFYDYDDMILEALETVSGSPQLRAALQEQYRYILVDEFQDTNGAQMRLLDLLTAGNARPDILAVGDDDQAIMRFQGASVEFLNQFEQHYDRTERIVLKTNYRSTFELVALGQEVARQIESRAPASVAEKLLVSHLPARRHDESSAADPRSVARSYASQDLQYFAVARSIRDRIDAGYMSASAHPGEQIAVICSRHRGLQGLIPYLKHFDIAYNYQVSNSLTRIPALQTLFALMRFASAYSSGDTARAQVQLPALLSAPELGLAPEVYLGFAVQARINAGDWLAALNESTDPELRELAAWLRASAKLAASVPVRTALFELSRPLATWYRQHEEKDPFAAIEFNYGLRALLDFVSAEAEAAALVEPAGLDNGDKDGALRQQDGLLRLDAAGRLLEEAQRFGLAVNVSVPLSRPDAVTLLTAHSSKGLEFDLVYLIDADDATWHGGARQSGLLCKNLLFAEHADEDDARRLLFVALTRARHELEVSLSGTKLVRELVGELEVVESKPDTTLLVEQSQQCWEQNYYPQDLKLQELLAPLLADLRMSVSLLNAFVDYDAKRETDGTGFFIDRVLRLPQEPSAALDFGSLVHQALEDCLSHVIKTQDWDLDYLLERYTAAVQRLDFDEAELSHLVQRLVRVVTGFMPQMGAMLGLEGNAAAQARSEVWARADADGIPLVGKFDLLVCDEAARTIKVFDYKTGKPNAGKPSRAYMRQLQFYKLLIEQSYEFDGWTVLGGADVFVEPVDAPGAGTAEPAFFTVDDEDLEHLRLLVKAVWQRIQDQRLDTSGFESSEHFRELRRCCVYKRDSADGTKKAGDPKAPTTADIQPVYEQWLIDEHLGR